MDKLTIIEELKKIMSKRSSCLCGHFDACTCDTYLVISIKDDLNKLMKKIINDEQLLQDIY
jgi:hypothetical protein